MDYSQYTVEDFVLDKKFRQWVLSSDTESSLFWHHWLQRYPEKRGVLQEARAIILKMPQINYGWNEQREEVLWQSISHETQQTQNAHKNTPSRTIPIHAEAVLGSPAKKSLKRWSYRKISSVAASVLLVLGLGLAAYLGYQEGDQTEHYISRTIPWGDKSKFYLPDGTQVFLNAGSTIRYSTHFTAQERLINITGEAFLEVAKDSLRPFRVRTGSVVTEALGTQFNVKYYSNTVEVALVEGKVSVSVADSLQEGEKLILMPGEQASLYGTSHLVKDSFNLETVIAWKDGTLFFESAAEQEVMRTLERWYGVTISVEGRTSKVWNYSGRFKDKELHEVLKSIGYIMDFRYTIKNKEVNIYY